MRRQLTHGTTRSSILLGCFTVIVLALPACQAHHKEEHAHHEHHTIVATSAKAMDVVVTQQYVCQIHSQRHIEICALQDGYLEAIPVREGQTVKQGDLMFRVLPTLYKARLDAELAEAMLAKIEYDNTMKLYDTTPPVVSIQEVALAQAKLDKANAKANLAKAELDFTTVKAPFDGIVDRMMKQQGSLIEKKDVLTTLSDNSIMWVYFNVPETRYLDYMASSDEEKSNQQIELVLANGSKYKHLGKISTIEAQFNNETGNIPFRADFPNPEQLLRHGQTGNILINQTLHQAIVIPQRSTFEVLNKRFVYVIDADDVAHQREIIIQNELEDIFVVKKGLKAGEKIVLDGVRQVTDGEKIEFKHHTPEKVLANQKNHAE